MNAPHVFTASQLADDASACYQRIDSLQVDDSEAGGFAKLMRATMPDGTIVAIKRFHRTEAQTDGFRTDGEAARREFNCLCLLNGANGHAPRPFALGTCTDKQGFVHHAIAMEYLEGFTVEQALSSGILSGNALVGDKTNTILRIGRHIITAIAACDQRVVHRDISPANVMLITNARGEVERAALIDWGQSVDTGSPLVTPALGSGRKLATICFGAPCVFGGDHYEHRNEATVDTYSFGALLYYMRLRKLPFSDIATPGAMTLERVEEIARAKRTPLSLSDTLPSMRAIERALDTLIITCTAYDPSKRPTPREVLRSIECALGIEEEDLTRETLRPAFFPAFPSSIAPELTSMRAPEHEPEPAPAPATKATPHPERESKREARPSRATASDIPLFEQAMNCFYGHGGVKRDPSRCITLLERAAGEGSVEAMFMLGRHLLLGIGVNANRERGAHWLTRASEAGHPGAKSLLN